MVKQYSIKEIKLALEISTSSKHCLSQYWLNANHKILDSMQLRQRAVICVHDDLLKPIFILELLRGEISPPKFSDSP